MTYQNVDTEKLLFALCTKEKERGIVKRRIIEKAAYLYLEYRLEHEKAQRLKTGLSD